jgi:predicted nucleotidyltransferase
MCPSVKDTLRQIRSCGKDTYRREWGWGTGYWTALLRVYKELFAWPPSWQHLVAKPHDASPATLKQAPRNRMLSWRGASWRPEDRTMRIEELRNRRSEILRLAAIHGASNVRVFGSVARGEADDRSDVDFLVDMGSGRSLLDLGGLLEDLRELLSRPVDIVTERGLKARIRDRVLREAVPL